MLASVRANTLPLLGFVHTAFTFAYEGQLMKSELASAELPPGALIAYLQKGLQYVSIESQLNEVREALAIVFALAF